MGIRFARRLSVLTLAGIAAAMLVSAGEARAGSWPDCKPRGEDDNCPRYYLNITLRQGEARFSVDTQCRGTWKHAWRRSDARRSIRQWIGDRAALGTGSLCIPLAERVDRIRIIPAGGNCGYSEGEKNEPDGKAALNRGGVSQATLSGCHAGIGGQTFGGIALDFADGYGFGDSYATGQFYGVYDGFRRGGVAPFGTPLQEISRHNTYHYRVAILANGRTGWRADFMEDDK